MFYIVVSTISYLVSRRLEDKNLVVHAIVAQTVTIYSLLDLCLTDWIMEFLTYYPLSMVNTVVGGAVLIFLFLIAFTGSLLRMVNLCSLQAIITNNLEKDLEYHKALISRRDNYTPREDLRRIKAEEGRADEE